jgi:invasion protein IalB
VSCHGTLQGLDCSAVQSVQMTGRGRVAVALRMPPDTKKPVLSLVVPARIDLAAGVSLQFGQNRAKRVALQVCDGSGCLAEYAIADAEIAALAEGQPILVSIQDAQRQSLSVEVPSTGFAVAYAKIK